MPPHATYSQLAHAYLRNLKRKLVKPTPYSIEWLKSKGLFTMGKHSYATPRVHYYDGDTARIIIGDWSALAAEVELLHGGNHRLDSAASFPIERRLGLPLDKASLDVWNKGDVVIGSDVWIGRSTLIMGGVSIGHGAVIAARSTVTKDVEPYSVVAGAPARLLRKRFDASTINALLRIAWWDWPEDVIRQRVATLASPDLHKFITMYDSDNDNSTRQPPSLTVGN